MFAKILPTNSLRRRVAKKIARKLGVFPQGLIYADWVSEQKDKIELFETAKLAHRPLISVVVPAYNTPKQYLYPFVYSVVGQTYDNWELVIVNASTDKKIKKTIGECTQIDTRIKIVEKSNEGISANTNFGIDQAKGDYIAFMDHDDTLAPDALFEVAKAINEYPAAGLIYSDEDKLSEDGKKYLHPHIKPDWSPDLLTNVNYITHLCVIRKDLITQAGMLDPDKDGAQDYDLILKVTDLDPKIVHIPKVLYHWREAKKSTASDISNKPYIKTAGERALKGHYERRGLKARIKAIEGKPGFYEPFIQTKGKPTLIISPFANTHLLKMYVKILHKRGLLKNVKLVLPESLKKGLEIKAFFAEENEFLRKAAEVSEEKMLTINDFVLPVDKNWAEKIVSVLEQKHVHSTSPIINRFDGNIEDAGVVKNKEEKYILFKGYPYGANTYFGNTDWTRNVDELTGAVAAVRKSDFNKLLQEDKKMSAKEILNQFSKKKGQKYNVITTISPLMHVRSSQAYGKSQFMNPSITLEGSDMRFYPNDKQIQDALEVLYEEVKR